MYAARVVGTVVCTSKEQKLEGLKLLVVQPVNVINMNNDGKCAVAVDAIGAGHDEIVLVVAGSSARQTERTTNKPVDATIMAIVDYIDIEGNLTYSKSVSENAADRAAAARKAAAYKEEKTPAVKVAAKVAAKGTAGAKTGDADVASDDELSDTVNTPYEEALFDETPFDVDGHEKDPLDIE